MTAEQAWALAPRFIEPKLIRDSTEFNRLRTIVALSLLNVERPTDRSGP